MRGEGFNYATMRCNHCDTGFHERCEGWVISRCECYCQELDE